MRLDLVLNDFVTSAIKKNKIEILSNGKPKRPLIDVFDMCSAIFYSLKGYLSKKNKVQIYNVGSTKNNFSILQIAKKVKRNFNGKIDISVNKKISKDKRSYLVNFRKYENTLGKILKFKSIDQSINELIKCIKNNDKIKINFRKSDLIRLNKLRKIL